MRQTPNRPDSIPATAVFDADLGAWESSVKNSRGERDGQCDFYRTDGSLYLNTHFVGGMQVGPFSMFHPNGELARQGSYVNGELDGELNAYATDTANALPLRACCVPERAFHLKAEYRHGQLVREAFFDAAGTPLHSIHPADPVRPEPVPDDADFDDASERWVQRDELDPVRHIDRYWASDGNLSEEREYRGGHNHKRRRFDAAGQLVEECNLDTHGIAHGHYLIRYTNPSECPHSDSNVSEESGEYWHGQHVNTWHLLDRNGSSIRLLQCGLPLDASSIEASPAFAKLEDSADDAEEWLENHWGWSLTESLVQSSRLREALCLAARVAALHGERERLEQFLARVTFSLRPELRARRGELLMNNATATLNR